MNKDAGQRVVITAIILFIALIFLVRLFYVQVIKDEYKMSASNNVLRYITDYPARGLIYDRKGKLIVYNDAVYDLMIIPKLVKDIDTLEFCRLINISKAEFEEKYTKARKFSPVKSSIFEKQLSGETYAALQEKLFKYPGFFVQPRTLRKYPYNAAAHLLGYIGEVSERTVEKNPYYKSGDYIGISGIEKSYEMELRGKRGLKIIMVDVFNREKGSYENGKYDSTAVTGKDLTLSLDAELQLYGERLMQNKLGSVVAIEPASGEILAMVSSPTYNPNLLVGRVRSKNYMFLLDDPLKPLFNRAMMAYYPPGSTFKLVNALVSQQEKFITPASRFPCSFSVGSKFVKCHPHPGPADLKMAVQYSCNPYFCHTFRNFVDNRKFKNAEEGFRTWVDYVHSFGVGRKLNVDIPNELSGLVPSPEYYDKYHGAGKWKASTIYSLGIGQGELGITPLQMANIMAIIANRGYYYVPHIVKKIGGVKHLPENFTQKNYTKVDAKYFDPIIDGMEAVVESGTARVAKLKDITVCGKTGTAQNPHGKDHSLFVAFAPKDNPKIAIAVMVENSGFGASWAAPIASLMMEKYLTDSISRDDLEKRMLDGNLIPLVQNAKELQVAN